MHRRHVGGFQRVGQQFDRDTRVGAVGQVQQAGLAGYEIRRYQDQLVLHLAQVRGQLLGQQQLRVRFVIGQHLARRIPQRLGMGPDKLVAPHIQAWLRLVGHQAVIQGFALGPGFGQ
ncbi:hypothetical protein D3C79_872010 [compost metagenome]